MPDDRFDPNHRLIPLNQIDLPVAFGRDGDSLLTPRDFLEGGAEIPALPIEDWQTEQKKRITVVRLKEQKSFNMGFLGDGVVDKDRAIEEVKAGSPIGHTLMGIEMRTIRRVLDRVVQERTGRKR